MGAPAQTLRMIACHHGDDSGDALHGTLLGLHLGPDGLRPTRQRPGAEGIDPQDLPPGDDAERRARSDRALRPQIHGRCRGDLGIGGRLRREIDGAVLPQGSGGIRLADVDASLKVGSGDLCRRDLLQSHGYGRRLNLNILHSILLESPL